MTSILKKKLNKKGFTLAELLVVVAIIAVLVAIAIPVFGSAMTKANDAKDLANVRAAYAELLVEKMTSGSYDPSSPAITITEDEISTKSGVGADKIEVSGQKITVGSAGSFTVDSDVTITPHT